MAACHRLKKQPTYMSCQPCLGAHELVQAMPVTTHPKNNIRLDPSKKSVGFASPPHVCLLID